MEVDDQFLRLASMLMSADVDQLLKVVGLEVEGKPAGGFLGAVVDG